VGLSVDRAERSSMNDSSEATTPDLPADQTLDVRAGWHLLGSGIRTSSS
jgi:hypothetical protein